MSGVHAAFSTHRPAPPTAEAWAAAKARLAAMPIPGQRPPEPQTPAETAYQAGVDHAAAVAAAPRTPTVLRVPPSRPRRRREPSSSTGPGTSLLT